MESLFSLYEDKSPLNGAYKISQGNGEYYETSFGYTLHGVEEAILFNNTHEGMHIGTILALRYFV